MKKLTATITGFAVAPIIPSVFGALMTPITRHFDLFVQLPLTLIYYAAAIQFTFVLGVPMFLLVQYFKLIRWWSALIGGALEGVIVVILINLPHTPVMLALIEFCLLGALSGFTFWLVWECGRQPDDRAKNAHELS